MVNNQSTASVDAKLQPHLQVEKLYLAHNQLNHVTDVSFLMDSLPRLSLLDLSDNEIRDIPFGALRGYPSLERLYLANNQIGHISRDDHRIELRL